MLGPYKLHYDVTAEEYRGLGMVLHGAGNIGGIVVVASNLAQLKALKRLFTKKKFFPRGCRQCRVVKPQAV